MHIPEMRLFFHDKLRTLLYHFKTEKAIITMIQE